MEVDELKRSNAELLKVLSAGNNDKNLVNNGGDNANDNFPLNIGAVKSYASKLAGAGSQSKVMIKPKNAQKALQTQEDLLLNVNLLQENIHVTNSKKGKDGAIIVGCNDKENSKRLEQLASNKLSKDYDVFVLRSEHPKIKVVGIPSCIDKESLLDYLKSQNPDLLANATEYRLLHLWSLRKNKKIFQATIQLDLITYNKVMNAGGMLVGLNICKVYDDTKVSRCFKCNGFNHTQIRCPRPKVCPICAEQHEASACKSLVKACINCQNLKIVHGFDVEVNHPAFDYNNCFAYKFAQAKLRNAIFAEPVNLEFKKIPNFKPAAVHSSHRPVVENLVLSPTLPRDPQIVNVTLPELSTLDSKNTPPVVTFNRFTPLADSASNFLERH